MEPLYLVIVSEPRHLLLGIVARILLYLFDGERQFPISVEVTEELFVADGIEGVLVSEGAKPADFVEHSSSHHGIDALIDAVEELLAFAPETYLDDVEGTWLALFCQE